MYEDEKLRFKNMQGYELNLDNPQTYSEKIVFKKLFDRNPLLILTADKYRTKQYARDRIGWEIENHLVPLLYVTDNPETIPFDKLPEEYIIKPNNGAGRWILVEKGEGCKKYEYDSIREEYINLSNEQIINLCKKWFKTIHAIQWYEWAYQEVSPLIIIEKVLREKNGNIPNDYRVCMFGGKCRLIYVTSQHQTTFNFYDENWKFIDIKRKGHGVIPNLEKPKNFNKMIEFAEKLSKGFDFIRIDFFLVDDYIYFNEITHYPASGHAKYPKELELKLGKYWEIGSGIYDRYENL